jgi:2-polyprenyl-3-methyl-5-hydroxy-6-metoxy-1,4-benzoquinol methylase
VPWGDTMHLMRSSDAGRGGTNASSVRGLRHDINRTVEHLRAFRVETSDPGRLYRLMAGDALDQVASKIDLDGALLVDVGGGPGYVTEEAASRGARCITIDRHAPELHLHGRNPAAALIADGARLPLPSGSVDVVHCSNVLEHTPVPFEMLDELVRIVRPGGIAYISFTNWFSPWGGHETSPWHYLGGERAARRYARRHGHEAKNRYGSSLFRTDVDVLDVSPRYLPRLARFVVAVPAVREVVCWNLRLVMRRRS